MKHFLVQAAAVGALLLAPSIAAAAANGYAIANVNMRSGPSTRYPAVVVVPAGAPITIYGCLSNVNWCDVSFSRGRGWVSGTYIQTTYRQNRVYVAPEYYRPLGIPTITFDVDTYWNRYYRDRDFYSERGRWRSWDYRRDVAPPPPPGWGGREPDPVWRRDRDRYDNRSWDNDYNRRPPPPRYDPPPPRYDNPPPRYDDRRPPSDWQRPPQQDRRPPPSDWQRPPQQQPDRRPPPQFQPPPQAQPQQPPRLPPPPQAQPAPSRQLGVPSGIPPGTPTGCAPPQPCYYNQEHPREKSD